MNIETQEVSGPIEEYLPFGWVLRDELSKRGRCVLSRDKDMENYAELSSLEYEYFEAKSQKKIYEPMSLFYSALFALLLVFPYFLYRKKKLKEKREVEARNASLQRKMDEAVHEANALLSSSTK